MALRNGIIVKEVCIEDRLERVWCLWHFLRDSDLDKHEDTGHLREENVSGVKDLISIMFHPETY